MITRKKKNHYFVLCFASQTLESSLELNWLEKTKTSILSRGVGPIYLDV